MSIRLVRLVLDGNKFWHRKGRPIYLWGSKNHGTSWYCQRKNRFGHCSWSYALGSTLRCGKPAPVFAGKWFEMAFENIYICWFTGGCFKEKMAAVFVTFNMLDASYRIFWWILQQSMDRLRYSVEIKLTQTRINGFNVDLFTGEITGNHGFSNMGCSSQFSSKQVWNWQQARMVWKKLTVDNLPPSNIQLLNDVQSFDCYMAIASNCWPTKKYHSWFCQSIRGVFAILY